MEVRFMMLGTQRLCSPNIHVKPNPQWYLEVGPLGGDEL